MPFTISCPHCDESMSVADAKIGRRIKCPRCEHRFAVHIDSAIANAADDKESKWYLRDEDGAQSGPISNDELTKRLQDGELSPTSQLLLEGWTQWRWADEVFQQLAKSRPAPEEPTPKSDAPAGESDGGFPDFQQLVAANTTKTTTEGPKEKAEAAPASAPPLPAIRRSMIDTAPWLLFLVIAGFLSAGILTVAVVVLAIMAMSSTDGEAYVRYAVRSFCLVPFLYLPSYYILRYYKRIHVFLQSDDQLTLLHAVEAQQHLWKWMGMMPLIALGLGAAVFFLSILTGTDLFFGG